VQVALDLLTGTMDRACSAVPCLAGVRRTSVQVGSMDAAWFTPDELHDCTASAPVILYFHGGAYLTCRCARVWRHRERERGAGGLTREVETPLAFKQPRDQMILRVELVGSHGRWKHPLPCCPRCDQLTSSGACGPPSPAVSD
jgi:hypothetical protein